MFEHEIELYFLVQVQLAAWSQCGSRIKDSAGIDVDADIDELVRTSLRCPSKFWMVIQQVRNS